MLALSPKKHKMHSLAVAFNCFDSVATMLPRTNLPLSGQQDEKATFPKDD
jgi:hypothetical protein